MLRPVGLQPHLAAHGAGHETLLRIIKQRQQFDTDGHFFAIFTTMMKRVVLDYIRERKSLKRGGGNVRIEFDPEVHSPTDSSEEGDLDVEALFAAVDRLAELDTRKAEVAWMRLIWGMTIEEVAEALAVGRATIERDWSFAGRGFEMRSTPAPRDLPHARSSWKHVRIRIDRL